MNTQLETALAAVRDAVLAKTITEVRGALIAMTITEEVSADAASYPPPYLERRPDPAYAPLLALVQTSCPRLHKPHWHFGQHFRAKDDCGRLISMAAYWEAAPDGALAGALWVAISLIAPFPTLVHIHSVMGAEHPDSKALEAVLKWLRMEGA